MDYFLSITGFTENNNTVWQSAAQAKARLLHLSCIFLLTNRANLISKEKCVHTTAAIILPKLASESSYNLFSSISPTAHARQVGVSLNYSSGR